MFDEQAHTQVVCCVWFSDSWCKLWTRQDVSNLRRKKDRDSTWVRMTCMVRPSVASYETRALNQLPMAYYWKADKFQSKYTVVVQYGCLRVNVGVCDMRWLYSLTIWVHAVGFVSSLYIVCRLVQFSAALAAVIRMHSFILSLLFNDSKTGHVF